MNTIKNILITKLRDKNCSIAEFRTTANELALVLAHESCDHIPMQSTKITTPLGTTTEGTTPPQNIVLVPILRSGLALMPAFLELFPHARIGVVGLKRDEQTAVAHLYYKNLPPITKDDFFIILDPMIATGGTAVDTLKMVTDLGIAQEKILFVGIISATPGIKRVNEAFPRVKIITAAHDEVLNEHFYIVPGLGDFGDRYFGTL